MKKIATLILTSIFSVGLLISCAKKEEKVTGIVENGDKEIIVDKFSFVGRQVIIQYPDMKADMTYSSDSTLHWKTVGADGVVEEGDEKVIYKQLRDSLLFISWIEKDGITVSQAVDFRNKKVSAFLSLYDEASTRGKRSGMLLEGEILN